MGEKGSYKVTEISENDAANPVILIYGINLPGMIGGSQDNSVKQGIIAHLEM